MSTSIRVGAAAGPSSHGATTSIPAGWAQGRELEHASRQLTTIEINGTCYSTRKPATFAKWRDETADHFVFSLKANRFATNRRVLAEAGDSIRHFCDSGIAELRGKLGPIVWQFATTKRFDAADFGALLKLLPAEAGGRPLRHAMDVRHESFRCAEYLELARRHGAATVFTESDHYPAFADITGNFVYARVMRARLARRRRAGRAAARRSSAARCGPARRVHPLHQRREGEGAGRRDGAAAPSLKTVSH